MASRSRAEASLSLAPAIAWLMRTLTLPAWRRGADRLTPGGREKIAPVDEFSVSRRRAGDAIVVAPVVIGPFLTAIFAGRRTTALVAAFAVVSAILSGGYNDNYGSSDYFVRLSVVIAGGAFSVLAASA